MKRYLFLPGIVLLVGAFARATATAQWDRVNLAAAAIGLAIAALSVAVNWAEVKVWWRDPRGVFTVSTGISVVLLIGILVLTNIAVWYTPFRVDLTASGRNTLTAETRALLEKAPRTVTLRQFGRTRDPVVDQLLASFQAAGGRIRAEFVDADRQPLETRKYGVIKNGTVVVIAGDKFRKVEDPTEQALITAVLQVTTDEERRVCFVTGHGEHNLAEQGPAGYSRLSQSLEASNYIVRPISLLEPDSANGCTVVVVGGAKQAPEPAELEQLTRYSDNAGRVALLVDPKPAFAFDDWLQPRGFKPGAGLIVDTSGVGQTIGGGPQTPLAVAYADHPITRGFGLATIFDFARAVDLVERPQFGGKPTAIARTGDRSFETTAEDLTKGVRFDPARDRSGPLALAAATTIVRSGRANDEVRIVVFGDSDFVSNGFLGRQGNNTLFLRAISWLVGEAEATIVSVQDRENRRIDITERQRVWMYIVNLVVLPLIPLLAGVIVMIRSRR